MEPDKDTVAEFFSKYDTWELMSDDDYSNTFLSCQRCGSIVHYTQKELHTAWHLNEDAKGSR